RSGISSTATALGGTLAARVVSAAPAGLAASVAQASLTAASGIGWSTIAGFVGAQKLPLALSAAVIAVGSVSLGLQSSATPLAPATSHSPAAVLPNTTVSAAPVPAADTSETD